MSIFGVRRGEGTRWSQVGAIVGGNHTAEGKMHETAPRDHFCHGFRWRELLQGGGREAGHISSGSLKCFLIVPDALGVSPPDPPIGKKIHMKKIQGMKTPHTPVTLASSVGRVAFDSRSLVVKGSSPEAGLA